MGIEPIGSSQNTPYQGNSSQNAFMPEYNEIINFLKAGKSSEAEAKLNALAFQLHNYQGTHQNIAIDLSDFLSLTSEELKNGELSPSLALKQIGPQTSVPRLLALLQ